MKTTILLIEDSDTFGEFLKYYLEMFNANVTIASTLASAREQLSSHAFDIIIIDPGLPCVPDGMTTYTTIKSIAPDIPRIVLSGGYDDDVRAACEADNINYLIKNQDIIDADSPFIKLLQSMVSTESASQRLKPLLKAMNGGQT